MSPEPPNSSSKLSLAAQMTEPAEQPYADAARALVKAGFLFVNYLERPCQSYDLTLAQMDVLSTLAHAEDASLCCSEIAERTLITKGGITGLLDRLEARGLVKRIPSRDDRRSVRVRLSAKGIELFRKLSPEKARCNRTLFEKAFTPEQLKELSGLLELLIRSLEDN
jgi:MarR family transcriptional regulator, 2-MHQ and catechol-resistance regulon repressor